VTGTTCKRTSSADATERLGAAFAPALGCGDVVSLSGELGAGKTRLAAGIVHGLVPGARVRSPSFTLVNEIPGRVPIFHLDLYRLTAPRDVEGLGIEDFAARGLVLVEWGERLPSVWLADALMISITPEDGDVRAFEASSEGRRGQELLEAWSVLPESW